MKIPDGNKPIKIGDNSFIYKGVYHPIEWLGKDPYRPRVEMLVIKDGRYLYARLKDDIDKTPPDKRTHKYSIPGGSIDADSSKLEQAIAETNEEALVKVALAYHSGVRYYDRYEPGFLLKGGDMPIEYIGSISDVYVGVYDGPYDKSLVEEKDLDDDMANKGKFHDIIKIAKYLRKEHVEALIHSQFLSNDAKIALQLYRADVINESMNQSPILPPEDNRIYHGSTYDIEQFQPMSLDLGNAFDTPGWSTFCFGDYEYAKIFAASRAFTKLLKDTSDADDKNLSVEFINGRLATSNECVRHMKENGLLEIKTRFYVYTIDSSNLELGFGNDPALKEYTFRESNITPLQKDVFDLAVMDLIDLVEVVDDTTSDIVHQNNNEYADIGLLTHNYQTEAKVKKHLQAAIDSGDLKPGDDIGEYMRTHNLDFESEDVHIPSLSMEIDQPVFERTDSHSTVMEEKYPLDCYGLPERKAYPMPDEKHVLSAIRFFNYAKKEEERELANNINERIQKFKMTDIHVGDKNRFKKYYKPILESCKLEDILDAMKECAEKVTIVQSSKEKYGIYGTMRGLVNMLIVQTNAGVFENLDEAGVDEIISAGYASLAEIAMNQMEILSTMEAKEVRTLSLPVMEAEDDEIEGATDYTTMADEAGAEEEPDNAGEPEADEGEAEEPIDGESTDEETEDTTSEEETEDDGTEEEATDYTDMADEAGAEGTEEDDTGEGMDDSEGTDDSMGDETSSDTEESEGNDKLFDNKEVKNYFLLNSFLSLHQTVIDVLDTVNGVVLPTPDGNNLMAKVVKNLQDVKSFVEKFIQFQFNEKDYAFNLYYYNLLISVLRLNLKLFQAAVSVTGDEANKNNQKGGKKSHGNE